MSKTKRQYLILIFLTVNTFVGFSQETTTFRSKNSEYNKALSLYSNQQYLPAQSLFTEIRRETRLSALKTNSEYYYASSAIKLNQLNGGELILEFVEDYPNNAKNNSAFIDVADFYFQKGNYAQAYKWYNQVNRNDLNRKEWERVNFNHGYAAFSGKLYKNAKSLLSRVEKASTYGDQAKYYLGYIAYAENNLNEAGKYFDQVEDYGKSKMSYYKADLNFKMGQFKEAIALAIEQLPNGNRIELSELNKIIGESYFNLGKYREAIPYLNKYEGKGGKWNHTDYYLLGYAYYKNDEFESAISEWNKIIGGNDSVAQNAYYHLAECYLKLGKKTEALNAFKRTSELDFDKKIKEDAQLNYAKLSYEIGNPYQPTPSVLSTFLNDYPKSDANQEIETLLIDSYISSKNYSKAMELLQGKRDKKNRAIYQKVTYLKGVERFFERDFSAANQLFGASASIGVNPTLLAKALFWKAETHYRLGAYDQALIDFERANETKLNNQALPNIDYHLGYTHFKLKNYQNAQEHFSRFINSAPIDAQRLLDATLRLGDSHFMMSHYEEAVKAYDKVEEIAYTEADYALFQKAMSHGYLNQVEEKIESFQKIIEQFRKSKWRDDALFELGNVYVKTGNTQRAVSTYKQLLSDYQLSRFIPETKLRLGLTYYNTGEDQKALSLFKKIVNDYPKSSEALQAISTAKLIYIDLAQVSEYRKWLEEVDFAEISELELDHTSFEAAEKKYIENKFAQAIRLLEAYLDEFPQGAHLTNAHYYLGELYRKSQQLALAAPHYQFVSHDKTSTFATEALFYYSQFLLDNNKIEEAIPQLLILEEEGELSRYISYAQSNLMKAYFKSGNHDQTLTYANKILLDRNLPKKIQTDAYAFSARAAFALKDFKKSSAAYASIEKTATGSLAAETLYYKAYFFHKDKKYKNSNLTLQELVKNHAKHREFTGKGLLLMAQNFRLLNDVFQAGYILENVIENFKEFNSLINKAKIELEILKKEEAETNASLSD